MSDKIKHECGLAFIRLLKPLAYYADKYGTALYGINKLQLLLQKQRNRGQDGAGLATIKLDMQPGTKYISRKRSNSQNYIKDLFDAVYSHFSNLDPSKLKDAEWLKARKPYMGELLLGHLRYGTHGPNVIGTVHPFLRQNNWISRNLVLAGNFNMTNIDELFNELVSFGQYPKEKSDTVTVMEKIGHFLDDEVQRIFDMYKQEGYNNVEITQLIAQNLDVGRILTRSSRKLDGGYVIAGMIGHGDAFIMRDPAGIRPAFFFQDDEVVAVASERPALQTTFGKRYFQIDEIKPGHALIIKKDGTVTHEECKAAIERKSCSFERIYFSRGTDRDIYLERKKLGELLAPKILERVNNDFENTVFSFIPNTAEVAFLGMLKGLEAECNKLKCRLIKQAGPNITDEDLAKIMAISPRVEKLAVKDEKLRTFIADDSSRAEMMAHVYDVTYGIVRNDKDTLALIDDSIVRGNTLKESIIKSLIRLKPKKIIVVSSAPLIKYPDCYGIDMSTMKEFIAFKALLALIKEDQNEHLLEEVYHKCKMEESKTLEEMTNQVKQLYDLYDDERIIDKIAELVTPEGTNVKVELIFQTLDNLHQACPNDKGDWYFSGDYPTLGGVRVVNRAYINFYENKPGRSY